MPDIDVDGEQLQRFIGTFSAFQDEIRNKQTSVRAAWGKCAESWKGATANQFSRQFTETDNAIDSAINDGGNVLEWLRRYYDIVQEFDNL